METFYSNTLKCKVVQINKTKARRLYNERKTIFLQSSNMRFDNVWQSAFALNKKDKNYGETFDKICNSYTYYNCDNERGKYIHFYVAE